MSRYFFPDEKHTYEYDTAKEYSKVDTSKLVKASPSDLQVGETYYILDNKTHEKKIGVYLRKEEYDKDDEDDDYLTVGYWFKIKDKDTGRIYEGEVQGYYLLM